MIYKLILSIAVFAGTMSCKSIHGNGTSEFKAAGGPLISEDRCPTQEWYSEKYSHCYEKLAPCNQYNGTDQTTCETPEDKLNCDWNSGEKTCFEEPGKKVVCRDNQWYSETFKRCFEKKEFCNQYNGTNQATCETPSDTLNCDWDVTKKTCFEETGKQPICGPTQWWSPYYQKCFDKATTCDQYSKTDASTCESPKDTLHCDWSTGSSSCYAEGSTPPKSTNDPKSIHACSTITPNTPVVQDGTTLTGVVNTFWPNGSTLKVRFLNGSSTLQQNIMSTAQDWSQFANIKFVQVTSEPADIRVRVQDGKNPDFGSHSLLGTTSKSTGPNDVTMNLGWLDDTTNMTELRRVVLHEFGHAIGFHHEHMNPSSNINWNKPVVYNHYATSQNPPWDAAKVDEQVFAKLSVNSTNSSTYDPLSIMHYAIDPSFTTDGYSVGWNTDLSALDKSFAAVIYPPISTATILPNYGSFKIHTRTALEMTTPQQWAFLSAGNGDLFCIKKNATGSGTTEVHVLSAASNYQTFTLHTATGLAESNETTAFVLAPNNDLIVIRKSETGSGTTEVHTLSAASNYKVFSLHTATGLHPTDANFDFMMAKNRDLYVVKKLGASNTSELHVLSAASGYKDFSLHTATGIAQTGSTFKFLLAPNNDLVVISKDNTGSKTTEVHILSAASAYKNFTLHTATALHTTGDNFEFALKDNSDVIAIKENQGASKTTEVHILGR